MKILPLLSMLTKKNRAAVLLLILSVSAFAQKITGTITSLNEPLPYVNVYLEKTERGNTANELGEYTINNVPFGNYTIYRV